MFICLWLLFNQVGVTLEAVQQKANFGELLKQYFYRLEASDVAQPQTNSFSALHGHNKNSKMNQITLKMPNCVIIPNINY